MIPKCISFDEARTVIGDSSKEYIITGHDAYIGESVTINLKLNKDNSIKEGTTLTYGGMKITKME